jgi:hypothetical protein
MIRYMNAPLNDPRSEAASTPEAAERRPWVAPTLRSVDLVAGTDKSFSAAESGVSFGPS